MNDHELDLALRDLAALHVRPEAPPDLRAGAYAVPMTTPPQRRFLPLPTGRIRMLFSATKLVVASAIVALFGSLLVAAVVTRPSDDGRAVGASASATAQPRSTAGPVPPRMTVRSDILAGATLTVEEAEPGVFRVISDGHRVLSVRQADAMDSAYGHRVISLDDGRVGIADRRSDGPASGGEASDDVGIVLGEPGDSPMVAASLDDDAWPWHETGADGTFWAAVVDDDGVDLMSRKDGGQSRHHVSGMVTHYAFDDMPAPLRAAPDGSVWLAAARVRRSERRRVEPAVDTALGREVGCGGLVRLDGQRMTEHLDGVCIYDIAIAADGTAWARGAVIADWPAWDRATMPIVETYVITPEGIAAAE